MLTKFPLAVGLLALVFAVGSLFGAREFGAGITGSRMTDALFWLGVALASALALALYTWVLQKLGVIEVPSGASAPKRAAADGPESAAGKAPES